MEILTGEQMRRVDRRVIEGLGIPGLLLMESAGQGVAAALRADYPDLSRRGIIVLCGTGNNGGDGLVVARHLARAGIVPSIVLLSTGSALSGDAALNLRAARASGLEVIEIPDDAAWATRSPLASLPGPVVLDALLGTGVKGGARGLVATAIEAVRASGAEVVSVDLPSGLDADSA